jgi:hypothetical protein
MVKIQNLRRFSIRLGSSVFYYNERIRRSTPDPETHQEWPSEISPEILFFYQCVNNRQYRTGTCKSFTGISLDTIVALDRT